uniref:Ubiquitin-like domain-containing protein n=1 Tax=Sparus aurata TaxID=8175 RepID=A0A671UYR7_SPAAU
LERIMKVKVCDCETERTIVLSVTEEQLKRITVLQLKKKIQSVFGIPEDHQRLIFAGQQLEDHRLLSDCGVKHEDTIHMAIRLRGG